MCMRGYTGGVATIRIYPYPAIPLMVMMSAIFVWHLGQHVKLNTTCVLLTGCHMKFMSFQYISIRNPCFISNWKPLEILELMGFNVS